MTRNRLGNDGFDHREASNKDADSDTATAVTDGGQPLALAEGFTTGSKSEKELWRDKHEYDHQPSFPPCSTGRTTLYAHDKEVDVINEERYEVLFLLQHGRQHPAEPYITGYSEGWDGQKVRQEEVWKYCRAHAILSRVEVTRTVQKWTLQKVMSENLNGFSRYYEGIDGAAIGFATLYKYDNLGRAKDSYLVDEAETLLNVDGEKLVDYVWRKYGDDLQ